LYKSQSKEQEELSPVKERETKANSKKVKQSLSQKSVEGIYKSSGIGLQGLEPTSLFNQWPRRDSQLSLSVGGLYPLAQCRQLHQLRYGRMCCTVFRASKLTRQQLWLCLAGHSTRSDSPPDILGSVSAWVSLQKELG